MEQGLIQWSHTPRELATWEPLVTLRQQFPRAPAWGHAGSQGPGNVNSTSPVASEGAAAGTRPSPVQPKRLTKPSARVIGPSWVN